MIKPVIKQGGNGATIPSLSTNNYPRLMLFSRTGHVPYEGMQTESLPGHHGRALCFLSNNLIRRGVDWPASVYRTYVSASGVANLE